MRVELVVHNNPSTLTESECIGPVAQLVRAHA